MYFRRLSPDRAEDVSLVVRLTCGSPAYSLQTFGNLPSAAEGAKILRDLQGRYPPDSLLAYGAFIKEDPVGLLIVIKNCPVPSAALIGVLLVLPGFQRQHVGYKMMEHLSRQARSWPGVSMWQILVLSTNTGGLNFWRYCGFQAVEDTMRAPGIRVPLIRMERAIKGKPACYSRGYDSREEESSLAASHLLAVIR